MQKKTTLRMLIEQIIIESPKPKSFSFVTDIFRLNRLKELDFTGDLQDGTLDMSDNVRIKYNSELDDLTGVVIDGSGQYGHIFDPTGFKYDPKLVLALYKMRNDD